jgi:7-keto-8-aminopelargonate synthetase-like enzyme
LLDAHFVITANLDLSTEFAQVLDEVVGKRIVVVEDEDHASIVDGWRPAEARFQSFKVSRFQWKSRNR